MVEGTAIHFNTYIGLWAATVYLTWGGKYVTNFKTEEEAIEHLRLDVIRLEGKK